GVVPLAAVDRVASRAAFDAVGARTAGQRVITEAAAEGQGRARCGAIDDVVTGAGLHLDEGEGRAPEVADADGVGAGPGVDDGPLDAREIEARCTVDHADVRATRANAEVVSSARTRDHDEVGTRAAVER